MCLVTLLKKCYHGRLFNTDKMLICLFNINMPFWFLESDHIDLFDKMVTIAMQDNLFKDLDINQTCHLLPRLVPLNEFATDVHTVQCSRRCLYIFYLYLLSVLVIL